ncbi:Transcription factor TFIIE, alpha subunit [Thalictrum thalictroides]|uniref:Transcription factor TFIIE, alpha subunit n=1 Tax=Thalictrum thalictroides TaxID=46969 RepID=A0A7J6VD73_THATH|nr:Transcription factor TFIIE, alpha subunit [Thalictrum thalictroides]
MSSEPFIKLVKLAARAFYDDISTKGENQLKTGRSDNRGMAVVILDALTRRQWVREEDLAKDLKLHSKQLRRTLRFFEEEKLVTRDHRKETAKGAKMYSAAVAATGDGQQTGKEGEEKIKLHTHSYCCLDYAQVYDVVRYRLYRMKKMLKDELECRNTVQEYRCPSCQRRYTAFDALQLISSPEDESFRCESCRTELIAESDKFAAEKGDVDDNARLKRREKMKDMLQRMEEQLKPLTEQLARVKDLAVPEFGSLQAWEARLTAAARASNGDSGANDPSRSSQGIGFGGTPMPYLGDTKVEVALSGVPGKEDAKTDAGHAAMKILPPWMITQSMNLTDEQRGGLKQELNMDSSSARGLSDDKESRADEKDEKSVIKDEDLKAYYAQYAALIMKQREQVEASRINQQEPEDTSNVSNQSDRQVGMKSKREESNDDVEWEDAPTSGRSNKMYDLNVEATASGDDEDDIDWEEG